MVDLFAIIALTPVLIFIVWGITSIDVFAPLSTRHRSRGFLFYIIFIEIYRILCYDYWIFFFININT